MPEPKARVGHPPLWAKERLISRVVDYVYICLPKWRDDPERDNKVNAEELLNEQLCTFLTTEASGTEAFLFHHEQHQAPGRRVDMSAKPTRHLITAGLYASKYETIATFEAKRLPAPSSSRKREYVTGEDKSSGGIQRYKLGLHGAGQRVAGMIGYVQKADFDHFRNMINGYIVELTVSPVDIKWSEDEKLSPLTCDSSCKTARAQSKHPRANGSDILIHHLWVDMQQTH